MDLSKFQDDTIISAWTLSESEQSEHADLSMEKRTHHPSRWQCGSH